MDPDPPSVLSDDESGVSPEESSPEDQDHTKTGEQFMHADQHLDADDNLGSTPLQKRRRVTRACDECRRKKIKCDGKQPCTHCSVYSYECTYDKPSNRRRNPAPQYIEALESRLHRAETLLRKFLPNVDLADHSLDPTIQQEFQNRERARAAQTSQLQANGPDQLQKQPSQQQQELEEQQRIQRLQQQSNGAGEEQILSMIEAIGQLDLSERGETDFHGTSSGTAFLQRMKQHFNGLLGSDSFFQFGKGVHPSGVFDLDSPLSLDGSPRDTAVLVSYHLPPKEHARKLCYLSLNCATCLLRIVHVPSFYEMFDELYEKKPEQMVAEDHKSLALLYSVLALGCMYNISDDTAVHRVTIEAAMEEGIRYQSVARLLLQDITESRDLKSLQALLFIILFLQAISGLGACYSFLGIALRSALRMGLHRHLPHAQFSAIEDESRRRVFYVTRQMDTYVSAVLGFPMSLHDDDIDQPWPTEVDDEYITKDGIMMPPEGKPTFFQAFNCYTRLIDILAKVVKQIYPLKHVEERVANPDGPSTTYTISYAKIKEIEQQLHEWYEQLPIHWRPSPDGTIEVIRVRTLLRFSYAHVQMLLYRPFLHYVSPRMSPGKNVDERYYACAAAAVSISRNIVHIGMEIRKQGVLIGPYWFILYTEFFAILSLVYYALENPGKPGSAEIMADAIAGKEDIAGLAQRSLAASRVTKSLNILFEQLPDTVQTSKSRPPAATRKRSAPVSNTTAHPTKSPASSPSKSQVRTSEESNRPAVLDQLRQTSFQRRSFDVSHHKHKHKKPHNGVSNQPNGAANQPSSLHDFLPVDYSSTVDSPESTGAPSIGHQSATNYVAQNTHAANVSASAPSSVGNGVNMHVPSSAAADGTPTTMNPLYQMDALMFPTGDPFAYPSQPMMDFGLQYFAGLDGFGTGASGGDVNNSGQGNIAVSAAQYPDTMLPESMIPEIMSSSPMKFFSSGKEYGNIESQLLGPLPAYLMQPSNGQHADLASQIYHASSMLTLQQSHVHNAMQQEQAAKAHQERQQEQQQRQQLFANGNLSGIFTNNYRPT